MIRPKSFLAACFALSCFVASAAPPITIDAELERSSEDTSNMTLYVTMQIEEGWHVYAEVPEGTPFQVTELTVTLPETVEARGGVIMPPGTPYSKNPELKVHEGTLVLSQELTAKQAAEGEIGVTIRYQLCDDEKCMPPAEWQTTVALGSAKAADADGYEFKNRFFHAPIQLMSKGKPITTLLPSPAVFDVDGDGRDELIIGGLVGDITVYKNEHVGPGDPVWSSVGGMKTVGGQSVSINNWCCVGMTVQQVDLNGDGRKDVLCPCFEGVVYWVQGSDKGFFDPVKLKDAGGNDIIIRQFYDMQKNVWTQSERAGGDGHCTSAAMVDWDDDGDLDLILGDKNAGGLFLRLNEGSATEARFATVNIPIQAEGKAMICEGGLSTPRIVDWDGDGLFDIMCGGLKGGVRHFQNTGSKGKPVFAAGEWLIEPAVDDVYESLVPTVNGQPAIPGSFYHIEFCDYDGDGDFDLLVGGRSKWRNPDYKPLPPDQQKELDALKQRKEEVSKAYAEGTAGDSTSDTKFFKTPEGRELVKEMSSLGRKIGTMEPIENPSKNFVWLYRRK